MPAAIGEALIGDRTDPFDPDCWWHSGRQVRRVLAEYGALLYYGWKAPAHSN